MSDSTPSRPSADRNRLFGILALQMEFISRDALIAAMHAWVLDKSKSLGQILSDQQALGADEDKGHGCDEQNLLGAENALEHGNLPGLP